MQNEAAPEGESAPLRGGSTGRGGGGRTRAMEDDIQVADRLAVVGVSEGEDARAGAAVARRAATRQGPG